MSRMDDIIAELCPDGVPFRTLGSLGRRNPGTSITAAKMKTLASHGGPIRVFAGGQTVADVPEDVIPAAHVVREPSIIVKSRGHIGFTFYEKPFTHKSELWSYTLDDPAIDQKFVYYYLLTRAADLQEVARATSVKLPQLGVRDTDHLRIPVPPLEVQREIVRILDTFTELEAELQAELEARRRQFQHYRDDVLSFSGRDDDVKWVALRDLGTFLRGRRFTKADYAEAGVPAIHYGEIYTHYGTSARQVVSHLRPDLPISLRYAQPQDVVVVDVGETVEDVGKAVAWLGEEPVAIHDHSYAFRHDLNPVFVSYCMQTAAFHAEKAKHVARTKVKTLLIDGFAKIAIPVPPLHEQERIVAMLDAFDALVNDLSVGLPAELAARRKQYEHYRDRLLTFEEAPA